MTTKSRYLRHCAMSALFIGACGYLWGCGARSTMDKPEDDLPTLPGTGGAPSTVGGAAGSSEATGGTFWATGGTGGTLATGGTGGTLATGGTGGMSATGGAGGTRATGGAGGGFIGSCAYSTCLWNLIRDCQVVGQCTQDELQVMGNSPGVTETCCSNGVDELVTLLVQGARITGTVAVTKNGNKCYDVNIMTTADGSTLYYVWLDASGQTVAKASIAMTDSSTPIIYCGNGESMAMTDACAPDGSQAAVITKGTCR